MSLGTTKANSRPKRKAKDYVVWLNIPATIFLFLALMLFGLPLFLNPFEGFRSIMPLIALICGVLGAALLTTSLSLLKKFQWASTVGLTLLVLFVASFIGWFRYNVFLYENWNSFTSPELFAPEHIFMARKFYTQEEYGAGVALTCALVLLGLLVSCVPVFRARDIPENIEKEKQRALRQQNKANPFRVRPMR
ncbi:MAG: hypothetical protein ABL888_10045 [Pirellulaceae bacterium]